MKEEEKQEKPYPVADFVTTNYPKLLAYCHFRWNGQGQDVLHEAFCIATNRYTSITFSLFCSLAVEAARNLGINQWLHDEEKTIIRPPTRRSAERLEAEKALAENAEDDDVNNFQNMQKLMNWLSNNGHTAESVLLNKVLRERARAELLYGQQSLFPYPYKQ